MNNLRYYQQEAYDAVFKGIEKGTDKQLLSLSTGTGKTRIAVEILKQFDRKLFCTHTEELIEQSAIALLAEMELMPYKTLTDTINVHGGLIEILRHHKKGGIHTYKELDLIVDNIGVVKADLFDIDKPIVMASMQTLWRRLDRMPSDHFDAIVVDECHYAGAKTWITGLNHFTPKLRLGLSATPMRSDGMSLGDLFHEITYTYSIDKAITDGFLCELDAMRIKTGESLDKVRTRGGELHTGDLEKVVNTPQRNRLIVERYKQYASGRQFIANCVDVQHAIDLTAMFVENDIECNFVVGDKKLCPDRKGVISDFKKGVYVGLCNVMVLTAGFDHPNLGCILQAAPTKSLNIYLQRIGRGTRLKDEAYVERFGQNCKILDFVDSTTRHKLINTWTLDSGKTFEEKTFMTTEKRDEAIEKRDIKYNAEKLSKDTKIDLLAIPKFKLKKSIRDDREASEAQLKFVESFGYDIVNQNYTHAMCNEIINSQPATEAQIWRLAKEKYDVSGGVTRGEAAEAFSEIKLKKELAEAKASAKRNEIDFFDL